MYQKKRIVALVAAAGSGLRMGGERPKQFMSLAGEAGEMILRKTLKVFEKNNHIDDIYLISRKEDMEFCVEEFSRKDKITKLRAIISGGSERQESVFNGLRVLKEEGKIDYVLIHDGVRPFVNQEEINDLIKRAFMEDAASLGVPLKESLALVELGRIKENLDRSHYYLLRTPQAFQLDLIYKAHIQAKKDGFTGTDDTALVRRLGHEVSLVLGEHGNKKITVPEDLEVMPKHKKNRNRIRVGHGIDIHALVPERPLILGGKEIPWEKGLMGHSDADVLTHAVIDAILGAAAMGDIGTHFPDSKAEYEGISSIKLLEKTKNMIMRKGYEIDSVDSVVVSESPKLSPYFAEMKENIARALDISSDKVNIKATSTERLGFCGREEGMTAMALATLYDTGRKLEQEEKHI